jgi:small subunit ribosomal protein S6e
MANFKIVVSDPKSKKAFQKEIEQKASGLVGKRIGENVKGDAWGFQGYEFQVTGGSDSDGFPMRKDFGGQGRKRLLLSYGPGFKPGARGQRKRKSVRGNTISASISQVNVKIVSYGSKPLSELSASKKEKKELTEEEKKAKLQEEVASMVDKKAPKKSRSEEILEEQDAKEAEPKEEKAPEKAGEGKPEAGEEKPEGKEPDKEKSGEDEKAEKEKKPESQ